MPLTHKKFFFGLHIDLLEDMSFADGAAYNQRLISIIKQEVLPDPKIPVEWMMHDIWKGMRKEDRELASDIEQPVFTFMVAQTDKQRLSIHGLGAYLEYRERDVGKAYV
jgi:aristolochene synthase